MKYLLDTNACIAFLRNRQSLVTVRLQNLSTGDAVVCSVVKAELYYGVYKSDQPEKNLEKLSAFVAGLRSLPFDDDAAAVYGRIRADLAAKGTPIGPNDLMIAALANGLTLVPHNIREFERVPDLKLEDWEV